MLPSIQLIYCAI